MTKILETNHCSTPARRRALPVAPILIRVPALNGAGLSTQRRRRLRREVRVAGLWLLVLIPPTVACATWGGHRPAPLLALNSPDHPAATGIGSTRDPRPATISLSLEPAGVAPPAADWMGSSVVLSGQLLPADSPEEPTHGGY